MNKDKSEKYFILSTILGGCILISYLVFVIVRKGTAQWENTGEDFGFCLNKPPLNFH